MCLSGGSGIMGGEHYRAALFDKFVQRAQNDSGVMRIQIAGDFIGQNDFRLEQQGSR